MHAGWRYTKQRLPSEDNFAGLLTRYIREFLAAKQLAPVHVHRIILEGTHITPHVRSIVCHVFRLTGSQAVATLVDLALDVEIEGVLGIAPLAGERQDVVYFNNNVKRCVHAPFPPSPFFERF